MSQRKFPVNDCQDTNRVERHRLLSQSSARFQSEYLIFLFFLFTLIQRTLRATRSLECVLPAIVSVIFFKSGLKDLTLLA
jgi:hypothetical protein